MVNPPGKTPPEEILASPIGNGYPPPAAPMPGAGRIAIIFHDFSTGGSERMAIRLANEWARRGRDVAIFVGNDEGKARALVAHNIRIIAADPPIPRGPFSRVKLGLWLADMVTTAQPDLVFSPGNFHLISLTIAARRHRRTATRFVSKLSNPLLPNMGDMGVAALLGRIVARLIRPLDGLIAISPALARHQQRLLGDVRLVHIDQPVFDTAPRPRSADRRLPTLPVVVAAGRLEPQKDFPLALAAFAQLMAVHGARLTILGEGPDRDALIAQAQGLGIAERVTFAGHVPALGPYLQDARLFLLTSRYEGYPSVLVEANAAGVPAVATDCAPSIAEILNAPAKGRIVADRTPEAIAAAMGEILAAPPADPASVAAGSEFYVMDRIAPQYLAYFDRLVSTHSPAKDLSQ